jgi:hypothetical protein
LYQIRSPKDSFAINTSVPILTRPAFGASWVREEGLQKMVRR